MLKLKPNLNSNMRSECEEMVFQSTRPKHVSFILYWIDKENILKCLKTTKSDSRNNFLRL